MRHGALPHGNTCWLLVGVRRPYHGCGTTVISVFRPLERSIIKYDYTGVLSAVASEGTVDYQTLRTKTRICFSCFGALPPCGTTDHEDVSRLTMRPDKHARFEESYSSTRSN